MIIDKLPSSSDFLQPALIALGLEALPPSCNAVGEFPASPLLLHSLKHPKNLFLWARGTLQEMRGCNLMSTTVWEKLQVPSTLPVAG